MKRNNGFALIEVVMAFFLITLLGTMILLVYSQTISKYDDIRRERKAYILVNNIHQQFLSSPKDFYTFKGNVESSGGIYYYDEYLKEVEYGRAFTYRVFYSVTVDIDSGFASLYLANVEVKGTEVISDLSLGKMRIEP